MKAAAFELACPTDLAEASALLAQPGARALAGGQSLGPMLNLRLVRPALLVQLSGVAALQGVQETAEAVTIGASVTHAAIADGTVPDIGQNVLARVAEGIAYRAVRNRGTIGGSLAHADPAADWVAVLPALGGVAVALGPQGERRLPLSSFVTGIFETALAADEVLRAIEVPVLPSVARWGHWKFCRKIGEFSKATACVLSVPGAAPRAVLAALDGPPLVIEDASALLQDSETEATRIVATYPGLDDWRRAVALTALRHAVAAVKQS